jgi:shikimate dehydrogenase
MNASADPSGTAPVAGTTRLLGVIGWPVEHSLSPAIHNAAFRSLAMDRIYVPLPVEPDDRPRAVEGLRALGFDGANVTMPHKAQSADLADELSDDSRVLHAVNTFVIRDGTVRGENTDVLGFDRFIRQDAAFDPTGCDALILGAGVVIAVRDVTRANPMIKLLRRVGVQHEVVTFEDVADRSTDLVVNATPVGSDARSMPPLPELGVDDTVVDLLYHPPHTPWRSTADRAGARTFGGLGLLLHQAVSSFELWTGVEAPIDVMSAAAVHALAHRD